MVKITASAFNPWQEIQTYEGLLAQKAASFGATCVFVGTMRDFNEGLAVQSMTLQHYPGMTEKQLESLIAKAKQQWHVHDAYITHRVGEIRPEEAIVLVAVWAGHRGDAFDACRFIMEELKSKAPFWKKEILTNGESRWVQKNTDGYHKT